MLELKPDSGDAKASIEEVEKRGLNSEGIYRVCTTERSLCNLSHMTVLNYRFLVDMLSFKK